MEVTVEKSSALTRKLTVTVPSGEFTSKMNSRLREIGKQVTLKGFRPGRIPEKVIKQRYGKSVQQEIMADLVQSSLFEAIEKEALRPAANPVVDDLPDFSGDGDIQFTASVEVYPEIEKIDAKSIEMVTPEVAVAETDIDDMLVTLQQQKQTWSEVEGKAADGHQVLVEYVAETDAGRVPEKGRQRLALILGVSGFDQLEGAVKGNAAGFTQSVEITFPDSFGEAALAGKTAKVELEVKQVQEAHVPEIDEEFVRSFAVESGSVEELREEVRRNLDRELAQATKSYLKSQLVDKLLAAHADLEVPASIVDQEAVNLRNRAAERQGIEPDSIPNEAVQAAALSRVRSGLLLAEIARQNNIVIDGARVRETVETVAETYEQPREVVQMYYSNQQLLQSVENVVLEEQVVDWVVENAKVSATPMTFKEVINAAATTGQSA